MRAFASSSSATSSTNAGFALVIALSLMAFVLLLILSISTLVQVETQSANANVSQIEARLNAKLGAMIALGNLQRYTGADQRITARSDILLAPGNTPLAGQGRWTGVWSSKANLADATDALDGLDERQPVWLVSGRNPDAATAINTNQSVALATIGASVIDKSANSVDDTVRVETEAIDPAQAASSGRYAFWVSDDGVKARVNLADPFVNSVVPDADYYRQALPQQGDATAVSEFDGGQPLAVTNSLWKIPDSAAGKISSVKNIPQFLSAVLPPDADADDVNRQYFHDFSVHSKSVLANVKAGGLRRDLSSAFDSAGTVPADLTGSMFPPSAAPRVPGIQVARNGSS